MGLPLQHFGSMPRDRLSSLGRLLFQLAPSERCPGSNHHRESPPLFADLMVKKGGVEEILPRAQVVVFDEAHTIEEIATTYFGMSLSTHQLMEFVNDVEKETEGFKKEGRKKVQKLDHIRAGAIHLQTLFVDTEEKGRLNEEALKSIRSHASPEINAA